MNKVRCPLCRSLNVEEARTSWQCLKCNAIWLKDYELMNEPAKRSKMGNVITESDGYKFHSAKEARRWAELKMLLGAEGEDRITDLAEPQVKFKVFEGFTDKRGKKHQPIYWIADFVYKDFRGQKIAEDVKGDWKGAETEAFRIKRKLFLFRYPDIELKVVK